MPIKDKIVRILSIVSLVVLTQLSIMGVEILCVDLPKISKHHIESLQRVHDTAQVIITKQAEENNKLKEQLLDLNTATNITLGKAQQVIDAQQVQLQEMSDAGTRMVDFMNNSMMLSSECIVVRKPPCLNAEISGNPDACDF